jgi:hypothetical protein
VCKIRARESWSSKGYAIVNPLPCLRSLLLTSVSQNFTENTWLKALLVNGTPQPLDSPSPPAVPSKGAKQEDKRK